LQTLQCDEKHRIRKEFSWKRKQESFARTKKATINPEKTDKAPTVTPEKSLGYKFGISNLWVSVITDNKECITKKLSLTYFSSYLSSSDTFNDILSDFAQIHGELNERTRNVVPRFKTAENRPGSKQTLALA